MLYVVIGIGVALVFGAVGGIVAFNVWVGRLGRPHEL